jgi:hypothetical protein
MPAVFWQKCPASAVDVSLQFHGKSETALKRFYIWCSLAKFFEPGLYSPEFIVLNGALALKGRSSTERTTATLKAL